MASLFKRSNGYWYLSFHAANQRRSRRQVATGTRIRRDAGKVQRRLEQAFLQGDYDPWQSKQGEGQPHSSEPLERLGDALAAFLVSRQNLSPCTQERYRSVIERLTDPLGSERAVARWEAEQKDREYPPWVQQR
jgi:hypothetical protein